MTDPGALVSAAETSAWLVPALLAGAVLILGSLSPISGRAARLGFLLALVAAGALLAARFAASPQAGVRLLAWSCALASVVSAVGGALGGLLLPRHMQAGGRAVHLVRTAHTSALIFGAVAFTVQLVILGVRTVFVTVDLVTVFPVESARDYGFGPEGLWVLGCLFASSGVAIVSTREQQLYTCQFLIAVMIVVWACLLPPVFRMTSPGGWRGTGSTLVLTFSLACLLALAAAISAWTERRGQGVAGTEADESKAPRRRWSGFRVSAGMVALAVLLLGCYQLAVPVAVGNIGFRFSALVMSGSAGLAAWACFTLVSRFWSPNLADVGVGLASLALAGIAVSLVPSYPESLTERYPVIFNAMMVGLAVAAALCTWLATRRPRKPDEDRGATLEGRLIPHAKRGAFLSAVLAVAIGGLMAVWPRLPSIAIDDCSVGRVTAGFGANLLLLLVVTWSARRLKKTTLHVLSLLVVASAAGFMIMRMLSYSSQFG